MNDDCAAHPSATYRIQLNSSFGFKELESILPYLKALGISHVYLSPYLHARPGSNHGYDISNHAELNPELGTREDFESLIRTQNRLGLGQIFDLVPNHMGILGNKNLWWNDVLENGPSSKYATYFDIDWHFSLRPELNDKVLLPILGCSYGEALDTGQIQLHYVAGLFEISYYDNRFPVSPCTFDSILSKLAERLRECPMEFGELQIIITAVRNLPRRNDMDPERRAERQREKEVIKRRINTITSQNETISRSLEGVLKSYNGIPGDSKSFNLLDALLNEQAYRLSYFRVAADEINYRRFFDVNELAALRMERREVFEDTHKLVLGLLEGAAVDGVRVDHIDGLYDPKKYLDWLQQAYTELRPNEGPLYILVEKILAADEELPPGWPINGTTGYEFLAQINSLFVSQNSESAFNDLYARWAEDTSNYSEVIYRSKRQVEYLSLSSELQVLAARLDLISEWNRWHRDFTSSSITEALRDIIACFPRYRTYVDQDGVCEADRKTILKAVNRATRRNPGVHSSLFDFIRETLLLSAPESASTEYRNAQLEFVRKFQQVTGPVMAKGVEDTAFYLYNRLLSLNEVGGDPENFGRPLSEFHNSMVQRAKSYSSSLSATATHDTKRGEDVRARINVLSEIPAKFENALLHFEKINRPHQIALEGRTIPDRNLLYFFYQTLIGTWPENSKPVIWQDYRERISQSVQKAIHEAKRHTSWIDPYEKYDSAVKQYVEAVLDSSNIKFFNAMDRFVKSIARFGYYNSLSQLALKICLPGVPDFYQGTELWDFSLVDPDNRRPVDYKIRDRLLAQLQSEPPCSNTSEATKLFVIAKLLQFRTLHSEYFKHSQYLPLETVNGPSQHLICFARRVQERALLVVVPRLVATFLEDSNSEPIGEAWKEAKLRVPEDVARGRFLNLLTADAVNITSEVRIADLLRSFPIGVFAAAS